MVKESQKSVLSSPKSKSEVLREQTCLYSQVSQLCELSKVKVLCYFLDSILESIPFFKQDANMYLVSGNKQTSNVASFRLS